MDISKIKFGTVLPPRSRRATGILVTLAMLDLVSYFIHCLGALRDIFLDCVPARCVTV